MATSAKKTSESKSAAPKKATSTKESKAKKKPDNYTDPDLRERLKKKIQEGDKGGKPGQWSARKAQLLTHEYEKEGGGYKDDKRTESQQHLEEWTEQKWTTSDGKPAEREGGTTRYLPEEAWDKLSPAEKKATNVKKQTASKEGKPRVANTKKAKEAKKE